VVQPRRGAYVETVARTGGGILVETLPDGLAQGLHTLWRDRNLRIALGKQGAAGVRRHYSISAEASRVLEIYGQVTGAAGPEAQADSSLVGHLS